ncbi:N-acetyltransferase [Pseudomonas turukhanskensis]|uniref:N-acetyltransferase n=1 Tax=Pseudomonas turukhanskensis TaxID=1806536 RepID=A0A9W6K3Z9_9PSED|nr:GNAT family protein [Pseudomonas turukhanskensis]GLK87320.1 N-acetyltransferase [Pseudomonas turukhanskensis]
MSLTPHLNWTPVVAPTRDTLQGRTVRLEALDPAHHGDDLWQALQGPDSDPLLWDYLPYGPFAERAAFDTWLSNNAASKDPLFFAVVEQTSGQVQGLLSYLTIAPVHGSIEIGHICYGRVMQRSVQATEVIYLLAKHAFDHGYRRLEWKCNNGNARSKRAAERFGFSYEGLFRQHMVIKDRNRDTAWYSIIDSEWPEIAKGYERWLAVDNFDGAGQQIADLKALREA